MPRGKRVGASEGAEESSLPRRAELYDPADNYDVWRDRQRRAFLAAIEKHPQASADVLGGLANDLLPIASKFVVEKGLGALSFFHGLATLACLPDECPPIRKSIVAWGEGVGLPDDWVLDVALRTVGAWAEWLARLNGREPGWLKLNTSYVDLPDGDDLWRRAIRINPLPHSAVSADALIAPRRMGKLLVNDGPPPEDTIERLKGLVVHIGRAWYLPEFAGEDLMGSTLVTMPLDPAFKKPPAVPLLDVGKPFTIYPTEETRAEMHARLDRLIDSALASLREKGYRDVTQHRAKRDDAPNAHFRWAVEWQILGKRWVEIHAPGAGPRGVQNAVTRLLDAIGLTPRRLPRA